MSEGGIDRGFALAVMGLMAAEQDSGIVGQMKVDPAAEVDGADEILFTAAKDDARTPAGAGGLVDGTLDGGRVECGTIAHGAMRMNIDVDCWHL